MSPRVELVLADCPCGCGVARLFRRADAGRPDRCPNTRARVATPDGEPFGRRQWDMVQNPRLLRNCLALVAPPSARKLRLATAAVAGSVYDWCKNAAFRDAVAAAEAEADDVSPAREVRSILEDLGGPQRSFWNSQDWRLAGLACLEPAVTFADVMFRSAETAAPQLVADVYHDVFPNPFRQPPIAPEWRTADVLGLAATAYSHKFFDRLPILADALEDAGCNELPVLAHARGPGPHARGCWVLDAILGRA